MSCIRSPLTVGVVQVDRLSSRGDGPDLVADNEYVVVCAIRETTARSLSGVAV